MKLHYLRSRHGGRVGTFATATPIANSITEAYVMQKYLRPDLLEDAGIADFDSWAATFGQTTTTVELSPDASSFRLKSRFAKFQNVPELLRAWHVCADVQTAADLDLDTPDLAPRPGDEERSAETVTVPASDEMNRYIEALAKRAEDIHQRVVSPEEDNMLKVSSDGRAAALDLRLVGRRPGTEVPTKLEVAAEKIAALHAAHREDTYLADDGESPSPARGSLQLVFCDLGTPKDNDDRFSAYDELAEALASRGVPRDGVRFIHEARNDREKGELFAAARDGHVAVLVGSTQKMGVGVNVQHRAVALHHLDCPWRPADVAQREGRIIRQGNQNAEVSVHRYVTEGSFDAYTWLLNRAGWHGTQFCHHLMPGSARARPTGRGALRARRERWQWFLRTRASWQRRRRYVMSMRCRCRVPARSRPRRPARTTGWCSRPMRGPRRRATSTWPIFGTRSPGRRRCGPTGTTCCGGCGSWLRSGLASMRRPAATTTTSCAGCGPSARPGVPAGRGPCRWGGG
jgi:hypothetical protein